MLGFQKVLVPLAACTFSLVWSPAQAQAILIGSADADWVIARACSGLNPVTIPEGSWVTVPTSRTAYFVANSSGLSVSQDQAIVTVREAVKRIEGLNAGENPTSSDVSVWQVVGAVQIAASKPDNKSFRVLDVLGNVLKKGQDGDWLLDDQNEIQCFVKGASERTSKKLILGGVLRLRGTVEELTAKGQAFETASSAKLGYKRERTILDDGTSKTTNSYSLKGIMGVTLHDQPSSRLIPYVGYELSEVRVSPAPLLIPPAMQGDGDTEILKFGLTAYQFYDLNPDPLSTSPNLALKLDTSYILDLTKNSERLRAALSLSPSFALPPRTLCAVGALAETFIRDIKGSCRLSFLGSINHITTKGMLQSGPKDEFVHAGFLIGGDWAFGSDPKAGFIAGVEYERQWIVGGNLPDIDRFKAYFKYRIWLDSNRRTAFDVGFDFIDGTNGDSFEDQNVLGLSAGVLF